MGSSTYGKGDTTRYGTRDVFKDGRYTTARKAPKSDASTKTGNLAGPLSLAPNPQVASGKVNVQKPKNVPRTYVPTAKPKTRGIVLDAPVAKQPAVAAKKPAVKPANVISTVTREKLSPVKAMPTRMAVNPFTGNTTGFTTGKMTGSRVSKPGVAGKTPQSAYSRQMANAVERGGFSASKSGGAGKTSQSSTSRSRSMGGASSSSRGGGYMR